MNVKVNTTHCQNTGLNFPTEEPDELGNDQAALPVPETYCTTIKNGELVTEMVILD